MTIAEQAAERTRRRYGSDPWIVADRLGLVVSTARLPGQCREVYFSEPGLAGVVIAADADRLEARELLAHGLGHHVLHLGDRVTGKSTAIWSGRHEREAKDFAACLLVGEGRLRQWENAPDPLPPAVLAEELGVSVALLQRRAALRAKLRSSAACI